MAFTRQMKDAGYPQVPVIAASLQGLEDNPGFSLSAPMLHRFIQTMTVGDLLQKVVLRTRPYQIDGNVAALYNEWDRVSREFFENGGYCPTLGRRIGFHALLRSIVAEFDSVPLHQKRKRRTLLLQE